MRIEITVGEHSRMFVETAAIAAIEEADDKVLIHLLGGDTFVTYSHSFDELVEMVKRAEEEELVHARYNPR